MIFNIGIVLAVLVVMFFVFFEEIYTVLPRRKARAVKASVNSTRSYASRQIISKFQSLPVDNQPYALSEIESIVDALDIKYGGKAEVNSHLRAPNDYTYHRFPTNCVCTYYNSKSHCSAMIEYFNIYTALADIEDALAEQARALEIAGVAGTLSKVEELTTALRAEKRIISDVTKELV